MPKWLQALQENFLKIDLFVLAKDIFYIVLTVIFARLLYWFLDRALHRVFIKKTGTPLILEEGRAKTLYPLLKSILFYAISFFALVTVLYIVGVPTASLLASASVFGLAVGFGAQSLVKDVISGFFIIFEDQFAVGEYIRADKFSGIVEEIGLRATKLRDWGGELHIIPNGIITSITNYNRGRMRALVDINLPYDEDVDKAMEIISQASKVLAEKQQDKILEGPTVQGIITLGELYIVIRVVAYTQPMDQWEVERELRREILLALADAGIRVPNGKRILGQQEVKEGT